MGEEGGWHGSREQEKGDERVRVREKGGRGREERAMSRASEIVGESEREGEGERLRWSEGARERASEREREREERARMNHSRNLLISKLIFVHDINLSKRISIH